MCSNSAGKHVISTIEQTISFRIVGRLNTEVARILRSTETRERLYSFGAEPIDNTPEEFAAYINSEFVKWAKVVRSAGLPPD